MVDLAVEEGEARHFHCRKTKTTQEGRGRKYRTQKERRMFGKLAHQSTLWKRWGLRALTWEGNSRKHNEVQTARW